jgi:long-subunit fatty acid transport protein
MKGTWAALVVPALAASALAQDQQLGARTKAMGGSYTAFEDDPVSIWLNPAGISTQPSQMSVAYQTYTAYPVERTRGPGDTTRTSVEADPILVEPVIVPSFAGVVFQVGKAEQAMAVGVCYARPYHLKYALDRVQDPNDTDFEPEDNVEQSLARIRVAVGKDFRLRPMGEEGWFSHVSFGLGLDVGFESWEFTSLTLGDESDSATGFGFGLGGLVGLYDSGTFKLNVGVAYQSAVKYDFNIDPDIIPAFDMPQQLNVGATAYLLEGTPLRVTADFQWIDWSETAEDPLFSNHPAFEDALNFSFGVEYRFSLSETLLLYPRLGYRRFDAPWDDKDDLPMTGPFKLVLDTDGEAFDLFTFGAGLAWTTEGGQLRALDVAADVGGDAPNAAVGFTLEF